MDDLIDGVARIAAGLLFIALAAWAAIYAVALAFLILVCAAPSTLLGVATAQLALFRDRRRILSADGLASPLARAVDLRFLGDRLEYEIDENELACCVKSEISQSWAAIFGLAAAAIPAVGFYRSGSFALGGGGESFDFSWAPPDTGCTTTSRPRELGHSAIPATALVSTSRIIASRSSTTLLAAYACTAMISPIRLCTCVPLVAAVVRASTKDV